MNTVLRDNEPVLKKGLLEATQGLTGVSRSLASSYVTSTESGAGWEKREVSEGSRLAT